MEILFWCSILLVFYTYFGYFFFLVAISIFKSKDIDKGDVFPSVSMIICAYNEEDRIQKKIDNCLKCNYPRDRLKVIIVSDASTDRTEEIISACESDQLVLIRQKVRKGKTEAQNSAMEIADGEIFIFTDVSTLIESDGIKNLVSNFKDESVGLVSGEDSWFEEGGGHVATKGQGLYVKYEMMLRRYESKIGSAVNASGCFYGVRKGLVEKLKKAVVDDLAMPISVVRKGYRVVNERKALAMVPKTTSTEKEFSRRIRIVVGGLNSFFKNLDMLNILKYKLFSFQLISHKLCKWLVPFLMIIAFISNIFVLNNQGAYIVPFILQCALYSLAIKGYFKRYDSNISKLFSIPYFFCSSNLCILIAWIKFVKGERLEIWNPSRS